MGVSANQGKLLKNQGKLRTNLELISVKAIKLSFYRNIVCNNVLCDMGLSMKQSE